MFILFTYPTLGFIHQAFYIFRDIPAVYFISKLGDVLFDLVKDCLTGTSTIWSFAGTISLANVITSEYILFD